MDALAYNGVILNNHYVQSTCSPSRAALLTGRYPIHTGMQGAPIFGPEPRGLPLEYKILPEYLRDLGYSTHAVGKWHLGFFRKQYTPLFRGFDTFLGYYNGYIGYYDHVAQNIGGNDDMNGYDMRRNMTSAWDLEGTYNTDLFSNEAVRIINEHDLSRPMFVYLAYAAVHGSHPGRRLEAPQDLVNQLKNIRDPNRRTYAAMVAKMDQGIGEVVTALKNRGMLDNTIIIFSSDNGAPTRESIFPNWGTNFPLRGAKETLWEGGVRSASFIWSSTFQQRPRVSNQLIHISDWLPTLYSAAGGDQINLPTDMDGVDQWYSLTWDLPSRRSQALININEKEKSAAIVAVYGTANRQMRSTWKLVYGKTAGGKYDGVYNENSNPQTRVYDINSVINSHAAKSLSTLFAPISTEIQMRVLRDEARVSCSGAAINANAPDCSSKPCLFFLDTDPCEAVNLASSRPAVVGQLYQALKLYYAGIRKQDPLVLQEALANPARFNNTWSSWAL
ncbi:hypothetical protein AAG570_005584 [Ranatra chinensis]|uniref:Sulfatase N-terminal domain-containing protein n=1 Tax=Ranatra chinensis TaxID=642074 RepID=A0ABD0YG81_9HEMI